jgi:hypothetical protein
MRIFERLDSLLKIKVVEVDLAVALREASPSLFPYDIAMQILHCFAASCG